MVTGISRKHAHPNGKPVLGFQTSYYFILKSTLLALRFSFFSGTRF